jgi:hypothetical protein
LSDKLLLVPGTAGCKLLSNGQDLGWPAKLYLEAAISGGTLLPRLPFLSDPAAVVSLLSMEHAQDEWRPTKTTLDAGKVISAGPRLDVAYNLAGSFLTFEYDWRGDIRASASLLLEYLARERPPDGGRWKLVTHSQGGLVAIVASKLWARQHGDDSAAFSQLVSHVQFLAVPLLGTANAAAALVFGENLGGRFQAYFLQIARTWPALYQMLPSWPGSVRDQAGHHLLTSALDDATWTGVGASAALLARARATRSEFLNSPLSRLGGVKVRITLSKAHRTANHLVRASDGLQLGPASEPGDTLVPYDTTCAGLSDYELSFRLGIGSDGDTAVHFVLANDPVNWTSVREFLRS